MAALYLRYKMVCSIEEHLAWTKLPGQMEKPFPYIKTPLLEEGKEVWKMVFPT